MLAGIWTNRATALDNAGEAAGLATVLQPVLTQATRAALERLYPQSWPG